MNNGLNIDCCGNKTWLYNEKIHRLNGPAYITNNNIQCWHYNGIFTYISSKKNYNDKKNMFNKFIISMIFE